MSVETGVGRRRGLRLRQHHRRYGDTRLRHRGHLGDRRPVRGGHHRPVGTGPGPSRVSGVSSGGGTRNVTSTGGPPTRAPAGHREDARATSLRCRSRAGR